MINCNVLVHDNIKASITLFNSGVARVSVAWGANLNFASPPSLKKFLKDNNKMSSIQLIMYIIIST